jgi:hypothetical protein
MLRRVVSGFSGVGTALAIITAAVLVSYGYWFVQDAIGRGFWSVGCVTMLLVLAWECERSAPSAQEARESRLDWRAYVTACVVVSAISVYGAGFAAACVVGSIAFSLLGALMLLVSLRIAGPIAIGMLLVQSVLFLTWPVWAANLLTTFESQWLVDLLVKVGPFFAINGAIDPTDAFTHRPLAYRLMNLGQDIPYEMPRSIWPCVLLHVSAGLPGMILWFLRARRRSNPA